MSKTANYSTLGRILNDPGESKRLYLNQKLEMIGFGLPV